MLSKMSELFKVCSFEWDVETMEVKQSEQTDMLDEHMKPLAADKPLSERDSQQATTFEPSDARSVTGRHT